MLALPFDIKLIIAALDQKIWYLFYQYNDEFANYACSTRGKQQFVALFTARNGDNTKLFGRFHSIADKPAEIRTRMAGMNKCWHYDGKLHRADSDGPAEKEYFYHNSEPILAWKSWYWHGLRHRRNWEPAIISSNGVKRYYLHGEEFNMTWRWNRVLYTVCDATGLWMDHACFAIPFSLCLCIQIIAQYFQQQSY